MSTDNGPTNITSYAYTYDQVNNRTSMTDPPEWLVGQATLNSHTYTYDDVYQLINATHPQAGNPDETFTYDPVGNRLTSHLSSTHSYDNMNRLLEDDTYTYTYDANGNLTSKVDKATSDTTTYQYDGEDKLTQVLTPTDFVEYRYDGFGRRIAKTVNGVVTKYVYDNEDILFELDGNNQIKARYTHGPGVDQPISVDRDNNGDGVFDVTYYYNYDGLGSVTEIIDSVGTIVQSYEYDTFGNIVNQTGSIENPYAYTGREWDEKTGLYFYRARYYDPTIGRFVTNDPIGFAGGDVNFYVYVQNNPINWIDPYGLKNYFTDKHGNKTWAIALDVAFAGGKIALGRAAIGLGIGVAVGTILEDVATAGLGITDDPMSLLAAYVAVREGAVLMHTGLIDLIDLFNGKPCKKENKPNPKLAKQL